MKKKSWLVRAECIVIKEVICKGCTREEAQKTPFDFAVQELECNQVDWEVQSVKENV